MKTFLLIGFSIFFFVAFNGCSKEHLDQRSIIIWKFNNEEIKVIDQIWYTSKKENSRYKYTLSIDDYPSFEFDDGMPIMRGTVLQLTFYGDSVIRLDANQQMTFDSTCYIAWGVNPDSNTYSKKEYFKSGSFSIIRREQNNKPYMISFIGTTDKGNKVHLINYIRPFIDPEASQLVYGQFYLNDSTYLLSHGDHSYSSSYGRHHIWIHYTNYDSDIETSLEFNIYNNGSNIFTGDFYSINDNPSCYATSFLYFIGQSINYQNNFNKGHVRIESLGNNYNIIFNMTGNGDTITGAWLGPLL
jgi:hypothetical protein